MNRSFIIDLSFLDQINQLLYAFPIAISAFSGTNTSTTYSETFKNATLDLLRSTTRMHFTLKRGIGGPALNADGAGGLKWRSRATAYMVIE